jgi:hypothetical protein
MEIKRNFSTGLVLGICLVVLSVFLMSSNNYTTEKQNKFEIHMGITGNGTNGYLLDSETGDVWKLDFEKDFKKKLVEKIPN